MLAELNSTLLTSKTSFTTSDLLLSNLLGLDSHSYDGKDFDCQHAQLATHQVVCVIILPKHFFLRENIFTLLA